MIGWLRRRFGAMAGRDAADDFWYGPVAGPTAAAVPVTPASALQVPAVVDALSAITQPIAHLPLKIFERLGDGTKRTAREHPAARLLSAPAPGWTVYEWRAFLQWNLALHGNAYCAWAGVDGLLPLHPGHVEPERRGGRVSYRVTDAETGAQRTMLAAEVLHLKAPPFDSDGLCGVSPVDLNRETLAHAIAVQNYGARFFANDGQAGMIIEAPGTFGDAEQRQRYTDAWRRARTGRRAHDTHVLDRGFKAVFPPARNNEHAQFLETRKEMAVEVARIWHVPPHKLRSLERATHSNIEQQSLEFVIDTLLPWLELWEQKIKLEVIDPLTTGALAGREFDAEFNVAGLLKGDLKSRYEAYALGRNWGWLSVNDIRRLENIDPLANGDIYLQPLNMAEAGRPQGAAERAASPAGARDGGFERSAGGVWMPRVIEGGLSDAA